MPPSLISPLSAALNTLQGKLDGAAIRMREETARLVTVQPKQATLAEAVEALRAAGHLAYALDDSTDPKMGMRLITLASPASSSGYFTFSSSRPI